MPRQRIHKVWREYVFSLLANERLSVGAIAKRVKAAGRQLKRDDYPRERTVRRLRDKDFAELTEKERRQYRYFRWPESMEEDSLPWEGASAALELIRDRAGQPRPSIRLARWYWRVTQIAPDAPAFERRQAAGFLALAEVLGQGRDSVSRHVEGWAAYTPWRSEESRQHFKEALERGDIPRVELQIPVGTDKDAFLESLSNIMGVRLADAETLMGLADAGQKVSLERKGREEADNEQAR
jgi:hypothetical protein